jgi:hypothetical protein
MSSLKSITGHNVKNRKKLLINDIKKERNRQKIRERQTERKKDRRKGEKE